MALDAAVWKVQQLRTITDDVFHEGMNDVPPYKPPRSPGSVYDSLRLAWRGIFACTMRIRIAGVEHLPVNGGLILAVCHVSHLDPVVVSALLSRRIGWMARSEFYRSWAARTVLHCGGAFPVNRTGAALPTVREGVRRLRRGEVVGIFPEGEIMRGTASVLRGGPVKQGAGLLASRTGCPVVPVLVLGTDRLGEVGPWLPAKRGRLWLRIGPAMRPDQEGPAKIRRAIFAKRLEAEFVRLFAEGQLDWGLPESIVP